MDAEGKFWVSCWCLAALVVCVLFGSVCLNAVTKSLVLERMVKEQHIDPMRAACALDVGDRKEAQCAILAAAR